MDPVALSRLHAWGPGESTKGEQEGGSVRSGVALHTALAGWREGSGLERTSVDVGPLQDLGSKARGRLGPVGLQ